MQLLRHLRRWRQNNWTTKSTRFCSPFIQIDIARLRIRFIVIDMCVFVCATDVLGTFSYSLIYYFYDILMITNGFELPMNDAQLLVLRFYFPLSYALQSSKCEFEPAVYGDVIEISTGSFSKCAYLFIILNIFFICLLIAGLWASQVFLIYGNGYIASRCCGHFLVAKNRFDAVAVDMISFVSFNSKQQRIFGPKRINSSGSIDLNVVSTCRWNEMPCSWWYWFVVFFHFLLLNDCTRLVGCQSSRRQNHEISNE